MRRGAVACVIAQRGVRGDWPRAAVPLGAIADGPPAPGLPAFARCARAFACARAAAFASAFALARSRARAAASALAELPAD